MNSNSIIKSLAVGGGFMIIFLPILIIIIIIMVIGSVIAGAGGGYVNSEEGETVNNTGISINGFSVPVIGGYFEPGFDTNGDGILDTASSYELPEYEAQFGNRHNGVDIVWSGEGTVVAPYKGEVVMMKNGCGNTFGKPWSSQCPTDTQMGNLAGGGNFVILKITDHEMLKQSNQDLYFAFFHMSSVDGYITIGREVEQNQKLGVAGSTGNSNGPHGHIQTWLYPKGTPFNYGLRQYEVNPLIIAEGWPGWELLYKGGS